MSNVTITFFSTPGCNIRKVVSRDGLYAEAFIDSGAVEDAARWEREANHRARRRGDGDVAGPPVGVLVTKECARAHDDLVHAPQPASPFVPVNPPEAA